MRLVYQDYNFMAEISQGEVTVIIAENPKTFCDFVSNIQEVIEVKGEKVLLTDDSGEVISKDTTKSYGFSDKLQADFKLNIQGDNPNYKRRAVDAGAGAV